MQELIFLAWLEETWNVLSKSVAMSWRLVYNMMIKDQESKIQGTDKIVL